MNRKSFLERLTVIGGCTLVAPTILLNSCKVEPRKWSSLSSNDVAFLDELAETILPKDAYLPGAKAVEVGSFIVNTVQECLSTEDKHTFITGLNYLESRTIETYGKNFEKLNLDERFQLLNIIQQEATAFKESQEGLAEPEVHYFSLLKELTISGYFTSKRIMIEGFNYAPIPGKYEGCIDFDPKVDRVYKG